MFETNAARFDFILETLTVWQDHNGNLNLLPRDSTKVLAGPPDPTLPSAGPRIIQRRRLPRSLIGGIRKIEEMPAFCAEYGVVSDKEAIPIQRIHEACERMMKSDVRYRFVIDIAGLKQPEMLSALEETKYELIDRTWRSRNLDGAV